MISGLKKMPFVIISADPKCFSEKTSNNTWTRVTYGSSNIHEQIPDLRDVGEYTHSKETMSWTFKTLPCKLLDRFERIGYQVVGSSTTGDLIVWTLQLKS